MRNFCARQNLLANNAPPRGKFHGFEGPRVFVASGHVPPTSSALSLFPALAPRGALVYLVSMLVLSLKVLLATGFGLVILALL
jgi:hypothetical protein